MSAFKTLVTAFCTGAVILGALYILVPGGGNGKAVRYAFCLSFLCIMLSVAVKFTGSDFPVFKTNGADFENANLSAAAARTVFAAALRESKIDYKKITVFTDKTDSGGISITKVYVYTAAAFSEVDAAIGSDNYKLVVVNE